MFVRKLPINIASRGSKSFNQLRMPLSVKGRVSKRMFAFICLLLMLFLIASVILIWNPRKSIKKHLIMISLDSVYEADFEQLTSMPIIEELIGKGAYSNEVTSVYPTVTYAVHTSIMTGSYPDRHGIYHNQPLQPGISDQEKEWFWYQDQVQVPSLFDLLKANHYTTANLIWPVTGNGNMTYNLPQVFALEGENQAWKTLKSGSPWFVAHSFFKYREILGDGTQPKLDRFTTKVAVDTIKDKKPNFLSLHLIAVDALRHKYGVNAPEVKEAFKVHEEAIEEIVQATKDAGIYENTTFVITTDHGQVDVHQNVYLNSILEREGYISETENGIEYLAYAQPIGLGAFIYIKDGDPIIEKEVRELLSGLMEEDNYGIEHIYTPEELKNLHAAEHYGLAIEAKSGYQFKEALGNQDFEPTQSANHGYSPLKVGYQNIFIISGNNIKDNYNIGPMKIVDIAPTLAELLELEFYECDGESFAKQIKSFTRSENALNEAKQCLH